MAKYIRTTNGIYQYGTGGQPHPPYFCVPNFDGTKLLISEGLAREYPIEEQTIVNQADTIEELCDNFMVEYKNGEHMIFHDFYHLKRHYELYSQEYHHISGRYGCMWVFGKGLIYVAKMNDKGELELLWNTLEEQMAFMS